MKYEIEVDSVNRKIVRKTISEDNLDKDHLLLNIQEWSSEIALLESQIAERKKQIENYQEYLKLLER